jgi:hypothetical protein
VAATSEYVLVSDREVMDTVDSFKCLRAADGREVWSHSYPAVGKLDYGNSPRATPLIHGGLAYLHGAFGHLTCVELASGKVVWEMDTRDKFGADDDRKWGTCSSPLIVDKKLVINPGGKDASVVALDPKTGDTVWKAPGGPASYGSMIAGTFGGKLQVIGFDLESMCGWDAATGKRLWRRVPDADSRFNVATPVQIGEKLLVALENNGTSLYQFKPGGILDPTPAARHRGLSPDSHTPVVVGGRVFGIWHRLFCLDLDAGLKEVWESDDRAFARYGTLVASEDRVLAVTLEGELILFDPRAAKFDPISRARIFADEGGLYSHPAFVGTRMHVRASSSVACVELKN